MFSRDCKIEDAVSKITRYLVPKDTKPDDVQVFLQQEVGMDIPYLTAHKAKEAILNESSEAQRQQFQLLREYAEKTLR
ncbi:hypothetical protein PsorP6_019444 [Peronosclerospora sorghi]|nr:hypothetical protein PsorP6_019444 [Peronosclerospora sorghi]